MTCCILGIVDAACSRAAAEGSRTPSLTHWHWQARIPIFESQSCWFWLRTGFSPFSTGHVCLQACVALAESWTDSGFRRFYLRQTVAGLCKIVVTAIRLSYGTGWTIEDGWFSRNDLSYTKTFTSGNTYQRVLLGTGPLARSLSRDLFLTQIFGVRTSFDWNHFIHRKYRFHFCMLVDGNTAILSFEISNIWVECIWPKVDHFFGVVHCRTAAWTLKKGAVRKGMQMLISAYTE